MSRFVFIVFHLLACLFAVIASAQDDGDELPTIRLHYIRHGQSSWNAAQAQARRDGMSEPDVKKFGFDARFTDAPLSAEGINQALTMRERLFTPDDSSELGTLVRCASATNATPSSSSSSCTPPVLLTSNLRRAIDTALLGLKPLIEAPSGSMAILPALQETCHYTDCTPLPQTTEEIRGVLYGPAPASMVSSTPESIAAASEALANAKDERDRVKRILLLHAKTLDYVASAADAAFVRSAYEFSYALPPHQREPSSDAHAPSPLVLWEMEYDGQLMYNDARRVPENVKLSSLDGLAEEEVESVLGPLVERFGSLLREILPASGAYHEGGATTRHTVRPVIITAHSRLLREWLFLFHSNRLTTPGDPDYERHDDEGTRGWPSFDLRSDHQTMSNGCTSLSTDEMRISNTGSVSFDLQVCVPSVHGKSRCERPTVMLRNCVLDPSSKVVPRLPPKQEL